MEVIISVILISVVITALLTIKDNNLTLLQRADLKDKHTSYIALLAYDWLSINNRNNNIFISDKIDLNDDDFKTEISSIKINVKDEVIETKNLNDGVLSYKIYKSTYKIEEENKKENFSLKVLN